VSTCLSCGTENRDGQRFCGECVLDALDLADDAATARGQALVKLRAKGNLAAVARLARADGQRSRSF
jgi:hypothetical protein